MKNLILRYVIFILYVAIIIYNFTDYLVVNSGDYGRITEVLKINIPAFVEYTDTLAKIDHNKIQVLPHATLDLISFIILKIHLLFEQEYINLLSIRLTLYAIFFIGIILLIFKSKNIVYALILLPITIVYCYILNSLYQESIVLTFLPLLIYSINKKKILLFLIISLLIIVSKKQMIILIPLIILIFLIIEQRRKKRLFFLGSLMLFFLLFFRFSYYLKNDVNANNYNKYYNGLGYTVQKVENWPVNNFIDRRIYFKENKDSIQKNAILDIFYQNDFHLAGTPFWEDPEDFTKNYDIENGIFLKKTTRTKYIKIILHTQEQLSHFS